MADPETVPCPLCGEPVPAGVPRCANCGADVAAVELEILRRFADSLDFDEETGSGGTGAEGGKEADAAEASTLFLCPSCGAFVSSTDARCPHCGADLAEESATVPAQTEEPAELAGPCPNCGSIAPTDRQTCAVCGASLRPNPVAQTTPPPPDDFLPVPTGLPAPKAARAPAGPPQLSPQAREPTPQTLPVSRPKRHVGGASDEAPTAPSELVLAKPAPRPSPRPERSPTPRGLRAEAPTESRLDALRDVAATATLIALLGATGAAAFAVPGREWGQLFAFGALLGIGIALLLANVREVAQSRILVLLLFGALALFVTVPVLGYRGITSVAGAGSAIAIGVALLAVIVWRTRATAGPLLAWMAGLLLLTVLAISPFVFVPPGPAVIESALWAIGGGLALLAAGFILLRRWLRSGAEKRLVRADAAYSRRDYGRAVEEYEAAIALGRRGGLDLPAGWYGKGAALVALGRLDEALAALDRALALHPENEIAWINKGTALSRLGRMSDALKCYNSAIKVNPLYEVAWNNKGNALARLGKPDLALACYERALEIDTGYRTAWVNKGFVLAKLGRFDEAAECADAALRLTTGAMATG